MVILKISIRKRLRRSNLTSKFIANVDSMAAFQYVAGDSTIHRLNPVVKMAFWVGVVIFTLATRDLATIGALAVACCAYYFLAGLSLSEFVRDSRFILIASISIFGLYVLIKGSDSLAMGATMALRTVMLFLPAVVLLRTTTVSQLLYSFRRVLPYKLIFMAAIALRFLPYFSKEFLNILNIQRTRGLRITPRTLLSLEGVNCLMVPLAVRGVKTADELSMSISSRAFGACKERTYLSDAMSLDNHQHIEGEVDS